MLQPLLLALACPTAPFSDVHVVDDDGGAGVDFVDLPAAIQAAAEGDTLLVRDGQYSAFTVNGKSLQILADTDQAPQVDGTASVRALASNQRVVLRGLSTGTPDGAGLSLLANAGSVWIEDCSFLGSVGFNDGFFQPEALTGAPGASVETSAQVVFARCALTGGDGADIFAFFADAVGPGGIGLTSVGSEVVLFDCTATGGEGGSDFDPTEFPTAGAPGGAGLRLESGTLIAGGGLLEGGRGGAADRQFIGEGLTFCSNGGSGGPGAQVDAGTLRHYDALFAGGPGGPADALTILAGCGSGPNGADLAVLGGAEELLDGQAKALIVPSPFATLTNQVLRYEGEAGDSAFLLLSSTGSTLLLPPLQGALLTGTAPFVLFAGVVPASGVLEQTLNLSSVPGGGQSAAFLTQGAFLELDGDIQLGGPSSLTLLAPLP